MSKICRILWEDMNRGSTKDLLNRHGKFICILIGHSTLRAHCLRIGGVVSVIRRACREGDETKDHNLCGCLAFLRIKVLNLSVVNIRTFCDLSRVEWRRLRKFVNCTIFFWIDRQGSQ